MDQTQAGAGEGQTHPGAYPACALACAAPASGPGLRLAVYGHLYVSAQGLAAQVEPCEPDAC